MKNRSNYRKFGENRDYGRKIGPEHNRHNNKYGNDSRGRKYSYTKPPNTWGNNENKPLNRKERFVSPKRNSNRGERGQSPPFFHTKDRMGKASGNSPVQKSGIPTQRPSTSTYQRTYAEIAGSGRENFQEREERFLERELDQKERRITQFFKPRNNQWENRFSPLESPMETPPKRKRAEENFRREENPKRN
ncbi:Hypothetical predicted protein [Pelobates cultripes]|uniref:Uncharacterized protein n=1 Tax=Pelobates cultripes TaxID=61616 RepID=A0AAD1R0L2_PELCU|nr:Hypothetical predicted protein [Pelobates cultripes]